MSKRAMGNKSQNFQVVNNLSYLSIKFRDWEWFPSFYHVTIAAIIYQLVPVCLHTTQNGLQHRMDSWKALPEFTLFGFINVVQFEPFMNPCLFFYLASKNWNKSMGRGKWQLGKKWEWHICLYIRPKIRCFFENLAVNYFNFASIQFADKFWYGQKILELDHGGCLRR